MCKAAMYGFIAIGLSMVISVTAICAQELEPAQGQENHDLIIEEMLDQIEKTLDSGIVGEELSIEPVIALDEGLQTGEAELNTSISVEAGEAEPEAFDPNIEIQPDEPQEAIEVKVIPLRHAEASGLIDALGQMKSPEGEISYNEEDRTLILKDVSGRLEEMSAFIEEIDILLETGIFALEYIQARDIAASIEEILTEKVGQVQVDEESNSVIVTDTPVKIGKIKKLIAKLDLFNVEISIASRILRIVLNDEHPAGVDWEAIVSEYQELPLSGKGDKGIKQLSLGTVSQEDYDILLEALDTVGAVRTVAQEDIRTENEITGTISGPASLHQEEKAEFHLTPTVKKGEPLEVAIKMKEADQGDVTVQMENGATIVIGGLFENVMVASTWKIPLLGDMPLLGFVFRNEGEELRKAEIITFLTVKAAEKKKM